jgi:hypothetical protein
MRGILLGLFLLPGAARATAPLPETDPRFIPPDAEGVLDVAAAQRARTFDAIPNPFRVRSRPPPPVREVTLAINSVLIPARLEDACVVLNGRLYSAGDKVEGLELARISAESLDFRDDGVVLRIPVEDKPARLRLAH